MEKQKQMRKYQKRKIFSRFDLSFFINFRIWSQILMEKDHLPSMESTSAEAKGLMLVLTTDQPLGLGHGRKRRQKGGICLLKFGRIFLKFKILRFIKIYKKFKMSA